MSETGPLTQYLWIAVAGGICGFIYAFGIGANDVANAFASSVSSKSLTLKQAVLVAGIFEFSGAYFLGAAVTSTIRSGIIDINIYKKEPEILMLGMFTSLFTAMFMLLGATYFGLPVSTTHTVVGCIIGFSIAAHGFESVMWDKTTKIFLSWLSSPLISGAMGFLLFGILRQAVLNHEDAYERSYYGFSVVLFVSIFINVFYCLYKAGSNFGSDEIPFSTTIPVSIGISAGMALLWLWPIGPIAKKRIEAGGIQLAQGASKKTVVAESTLATTDNVKKVDDEEVGYSEDDSNYEYNDCDDPPEPKAKKVSVATPVNMSTIEPVKKIPEQTQTTADKTEQVQSGNMLARMSKKFADSTYNQDLHEQSMAENAGAAEIWDNAEKYDDKVEQMFTYVQVFTACLNAFAHGANDTANAIAPISAVITIYQTGQVSSKAPVQKWLLAYGGAGIVLGLLIYGYKVMKSIGYKLTMMSPSRGASAELAASFTVVTASFMAIPVSSTQCIVGAVAGVGLTQGWRNVQWLFLGRVCVGWVIIFFTSATLSAGVFAFCAFSPSIY